MKLEKLLQYFFCFNECEIFLFQNDFEPVKIYRGHYISDEAIRNDIKLKEYLNCEIVQWQAIKDDLYIIINVRSKE